MSDLLKRIDEFEINLAGSAQHLRGSFRGIVIDLVRDCRAEIERLERQVEAANSESREQAKTIARLRSEAKKCPHRCDSCKDFERHAQ